MEYIRCEIYFGLNVTVFLAILLWHVTVMTLVLSHRISWPVYVLFSCCYFIYSHATLHQNPAGLMNWYHERSYEPTTIIAHSYTGWQARGSKDWCPTSSGEMVNLMLKFKGLCTEDKGGHPDINGELWYKESLSEYLSRRPCTGGDEKKTAPTIMTFCTVCHLV